MGRSQAWNQEAWLLALAMILGSPLTILSPSFLSCKMGMIFSTQGLWEGYIRQEIGVTGIYIGQMELQVSSPLFQTF